MPNRTTRRLGSIVWVACLAIGAFEAIATAQTRPSFFDQPSEARTIGTPAARRRVPLLVFLPPTNATSEEMFERVRATVPFDAYVAMLPPGRPRSSDYLPGFGSFVGWMDERLAADLARAKRDLPVDPERIYLIGFSLGGDLSWALLVRHPETYRGALVIGSRSSAVPRAPALRGMRDRRVRVAFVIGNQDDAARVEGMERAYGTVRAASIPAEMFRYDGAHVYPSDTRVLSRAMRFLFGR